MGHITALLNFSPIINYANQQNDFVLAIKYELSNKDQDEDIPVPKHKHLKTFTFFFNPNLILTVYKLMCIKTGTGK
jgi:hypothetical protein